MTTETKREKQAEERALARKKFGEILAGFDPHCRPRWKKFGCILMDGPSEMVLIDALKSYPRQQRILASFTGIDENDLKAVNCEFDLQVKILGLCPLSRPGTAFQKPGDGVFWLFFAMVVQGKHRDKHIVGAYCTKRKEGHFEVISRPKSQRR